MASDESIYSPLDASKKEIRLIEIIATEPEVQVRLHTVSLQERPTFVALSYVWGDANITAPVTVNGFTRNVTTNLAQALRSIPIQCENHRPGQYDLRVWADALCINQNDVAERNHQVAYMSRLYSSAELVVCWLGPGDDVVALRGLHILRDMAHDLETMPSGENETNSSFGLLAKYKDVFRTSNEGPRPAHGAICTVMALPYWSRVWIFQEMALAKNATLVYGELSMSLNQLLLLSKWCNYRHEDIAERIKQLRGIIWRTQIICGVKEVIASIARFCETPGLPVPRPIRHGGESSLGSSSISLAATMQNVASENMTLYTSLRQELWKFSAIGMSLAATNAKDHIYGLLGLHNLDLEVRYGEQATVADVYVEYFALWLREFSYLKHHRTMDMSALDMLWLLHMSGAGYEWYSEPGFPSWVPNFPGMSRAGSEYRIISKKGHQADLEVFNHCSQSYRVESYSFFTLAIVSDTIQYLGPSLVDCLRCTEGFGSWMSEFHSRHPITLQSYQHPIVAICDTADFLDQYQVSFQMRKRTLNDVSHFLHSWLRIAITYYDDITCSEQFWRRMGLEGRMSRPTYPPSQSSFLTYLESQPFREKVLNTSSFGGKIGELDRLACAPLRVAETTSGRVCMVPLGTKEGDKIAVVQGSGVPSVLRPRGTHYEHVGISYVIGLMNGEARQLVEAGDAKIETIEMR